MRTTSQSESTRVPPVTALRSPPLSRMTGALSPVIGALVDRGDAFDDFAVAGNDVARFDEHDVALAQRRAPTTIVTARVARGSASFFAGDVARAPCAARRPAPCRALRPSPRRSSRRAR